MPELSTKRVFVTREHIIPEAIASLRQSVDVEVWSERSAPPRDVFLRKARESDGMITEITDLVDKELLDQAPRLKVVANRAVGMDNIDIGEATAHGVFVSNTPGVLHESCADFTFGLMLSVARNITYGDRRIREGEWKVFDQIPYLGTDVHGATLGIIGMGLIGTAVVRRAQAFDMKVIYFSRNRKPEVEKQLGVEWRPDMDDLLAESDFVSLHVPLTAETQRIIGKRELELMQPHSFLINTTRGPTVDPGALYEAVKTGQIAGAALDVTDPEPIPFDDPLLSLPNVVISPHIASASSSTVRKMGELTAQNVIGALSGTAMPSCVNPEAAANR
ncbi:MAG: D-glycerate dehydrogenase [SAR202 cluster bacterium]|jgi:glyoxylate reductase|nr:D-glycerate dehydrogenase [SAR202 cluster bacterium]MDP6300338.1 D-glycerate dehydrogenase [SAR202 cluster bacterium]MDP7103112.1 D-glycerate dehydrogenase [SAR202 cluster bacterium]MDP7224523.1 D-glycerate dehydrogenase [SAR202 cluster bacterium]MDP7414092.1 D-glycerate dehydrogenase [SAR202 cluster bacterium]